MGELKLNVADGEEDLKELEANQEGLESAFDDCLGGGQVKAGMACVETSLKEEVEGLKATNEELRIKVAILERAVANGVSCTLPTPRARIPEPKP